MTKSYALLLLFFFTYVSHSQILFEKGYFINNNGKVTNCYIKNSDWRSNPTIFKYKLNTEDKETMSEDIATVSEFGIDNVSKFKRFTVNIEYSGNNVSSLTESKNPV